MQDCKLYNPKGGIATQHSNTKSPHEGQIVTITTNTHTNAALIHINWFHQIYGIKTLLIPAWIKTRNKKQPYDAVSFTKVALSLMAGKAAK